jgi:hypothetical protein
MLTVSDDVDDWRGEKCRELSREMVKRRDRDLAVVR